MSVHNVINEITSSKVSDPAVFSGGISSINPEGGIGYGAGAGGAVTQVTSEITPVTLNKVCGQITTVSLTTAAAGGTSVFLVNNSTVAPTDAIVLSMTYSGAGTPVLGVRGVTDGVFSIAITNVHATLPLNVAMIINFAVIKCVAA